MQWLIKVKHHNLYLGKPERTMTAFLGEARLFASQAEGRAIIPDLPLIVEYECVVVQVAVQDQIRSFIREYERNSQKTAGETAAVAALRTLTFHVERDPAALVTATGRLIEVLQTFQGMCSRMETKDEAQLHAAPSV